MSDITLNVGDKGIFNYRVGGIIIDENEILTVFNGVYYYTVGGRIQFCESSEEAISREIFEEIGIHVEIENLAFIHEVFYEHNDLPCHELELIYYLKPVSNIKNLINVKEEKLKLEWISLEKLNEYKLYPKFFKDELKDLESLKSKTKRIVTLDINNKNHK